MANYQFSIITTHGEAFNGQVESLVAPGKLGFFGILSDHAPLIASLCRGPLTVTQNGTKNYFAISSGVLKVNEQSNVLLLVDSARKVETIDEAKNEETIDAGK